MSAQRQRYGRATPECPGRAHCETCRHPRTEMPLFWTAWEALYCCALNTIKDARVEEIRRLLPQAMLRDWVRLGSRLVRLLRDHHHPALHESVLERLLVQARESVDLRGRR